MSKTYSIRRRLIAVIIAGVVLVLTTTAILLDTLLAAKMQQLFDENLSNKARTLASLTNFAQSGIVFNLSDELMPEFSRPKDPEYFQLWRQDGTVIARSNSLHGANLPRFDTALHEYSLHDISLPDKRSGRLVEIIFLPHIKNDADPIELATIERPVVILAFAREWVSVEQLRLATRSIIGGTMFFILATIAILVGKYVRTYLQPLQQLAEQVRHIDVHALDTRIKYEEEQAQELAPIELQLNNLLDRLQAAFEREKGFASDVAHELRTPLAELKTLAEVGKRIPEERRTVESFFDDVYDVSKQMESIVTSLLDLARLDAGLMKIYTSDFRLREIVDEIWSPALENECDKRKLDNTIPMNTTVATDREKLELILRNLLTNAIQYSLPGTTIRAGVQIEQDNMVTLRIENQTSNLEPTDLERMGQRFWRKNHSHNKEGHAGLGLALVHSLASLLKIRVALDLEVNGAFAVSLCGLHQTPAGEHLIHKIQEDSGH